MKTNHTNFSLVETDGLSQSKTDENTDLSDSFKVTISETLQTVVTVNAGSSDEAEQMVSDNWRAGDYILDAGNFVGVDFTAVPMVA